MKNNIIPYIFLFIATFLNSFFAMPNFEIVNRNEWHARPPKSVEKMTNPVPYVVIHHSYIPSACNNKEICILAMKKMQDLHQLSHGWNDIGYNFAVGGDGRVYIGRGWNNIGAHAPLVNNQSIGICVIGDWQNELPPIEQLQSVKELIEFGVNDGFIQNDYKLIGHRQVRDTECPGNRLFKEIQQWKNFWKCSTI